MPENETQEITTMPQSPKQGIKKYMNAEEGLTLNLKIIIVIALFSILLLIIGTIILLNSYTPHATQISSSSVKQNQTSLQGAINIPSTISKSNLILLQGKTTAFVSDLQQDEQLYEKQL